jgi:hypothetical protein
MVEAADLDLPAKFGPTVVGDELLEDCFQLHAMQRVVRLFLRHDEVNRTKSPVPLI